MQRNRSLVFALLFAASAPALAVEGMITSPSSYGPKPTMDRLEAVLKEKGLTIFARVDHAAGAAKVGKTLRPTEVLIFGNPAGGTPLMECSQTAGIDLPLKALVWEDAAGKVWLAYNDPAYLAARHGAPECAAVGNLQKALAGFASAALAR
ncbi:MAG: DUF302 domain-containing protein [Casimicrobiaceae bacterium]